MLQKQGKRKELFYSRGVYRAGICDQQRADNQQQDDRCRIRNAGKINLVFRMDDVNEIIADQRAGQINRIILQRDFPEVFRFQILP